MSIACAVHLQRLLDRESAWRRRELTATYLAVPSENPPSVYCRQAVLMLYAHVEGFVKAASTAYLDAVSRVQRSTAKLHPVLIGLAVRSAIEGAVKSRDLQKLGEFVVLTVTAAANLPVLTSAGAIKTKSNLSSKRLRDILGTLGLNRKRFEDVETDVIDRLVRWRNAIAHGRGLPIDHDDYKAMHHNVIDFLDSYREYLEDCARSSAYLR